MNHTVIRGMVAAFAAGATLLTAGGQATAAVAAKPDVATIVAGAYKKMWAHQDGGTGPAVCIEPNTTRTLFLIRGVPGSQPTTLRFSTGSDETRPTVAQIPIPAPGQLVDCVVSDADATSTVNCTIKPTS